MKYFISDLHLCHGSMNKYMDCRGFKSVNEMNEYIVNQWNSKVKPTDEVYILGDFCTGNGSQANFYLNQMNGVKYLITGNHDNFLKDADFNKKALKWYGPYLELNVNNKLLILSHYPITCYNGQYRRDKNGVPKVHMLYGHVHDTRDQILINDHINRMKQTKFQLKKGEEKGYIPCEMINCFCMFSDYVPLSFEEWKKLDEKRRLELTEHGQKAEECCNTVPKRSRRPKK